MLRYLAIFAIALAVRLVHIWQIHRAPFFTVLMGDSRSYDEWARRIAGGEWIGRDVFYQAPLYPYCLGVLYAIAGHHLLLVRLVQAVFGSLACVFLALAATRFFSPRDPEPSQRVGFVAGLMLALYAPAIFFDGLIQKSTLDVFFVCLALWLVSRTINAETAEPAEPSETKEHKKRSSSLRVPRVLRSTWTGWLALGMAIGALTLTRENAIVFTVVIAAWAVLANNAKAATQRETRRNSLRPLRPLRSSWRSLALFLLGVAIVVMPVAIRNSLVGGGFYVTTSQFGPNFFIGNNPRSDGSYQSLRYGRGAPEYERQDATELAERAAGRTLTPAEVSSYWTERALDFIAGHPGEWLRLMGRKVALLVNRTELLDTESQESHAEWSLPLRLTSIVGHFGILVPLAAAGLIVSWPRRRRLGVLYAMLSAYAASVVLFYVFARYRYPLVPFLVLFAAAGLLFLIGVGADPRVGPGADTRVRPYMIGVIAIVAIFANWPILSADMNRAVSEHNLGAALQGDGRYDEAITHYRRALTFRSDYAPAYNNLASSLRSKGQLREAIATYEQALRLQPEYPEAHYNLANALLADGRREEAVAHFQRALESMAGSADVHNNLGIALMEKGQVAEAVTEFRQAIQLEPGSAKAHRNLGDALTTMGKRAEGLDHLRRAAELEPNEASHHYDLGSALLEAGKPDEAVAELRAAVRLDGTSVEAHNNLGIALGSQGRLDEAIGEFQEALRIKPDFADAQRNLAMALAARRRPTTKD